MSEEGSKSFSLNLNDVKKLAKHALLVGGAASLTIVGENLHIIDLGQWGPLLVPAISIGIDMLIKWMRDNTPKKD